MVSSGVVDHRHRRFLAAGIVGVAVLTPAPHPTPVHDPPVLLVADAAPLDLESFAAAAGTPIGVAIENFYLAVEPWARYGANLTSWAAGWVPVAGLLAPQINFFYDFGEAITRSWVFNAAGVLDGDLGLGQAFANIGSDTTAAFDAFVHTQINWVTHLLPPLPPFPTPPPLPPIGSSAAEALGGLGGLDSVDGADPGPLHDLLSLAP
ncbi:hypothetical protein KIH27_18395 [Mycobacterium sp. M1]|uniref:PE-PPE domain-containing protein n=1 Tax=Mycolicibacter acidiphilus TaxID=2835306 RepID=A0ABS5RMZ2_9MYCO|nr:hypothetical protein [Mycolicibacter acidiphilus]MBS9535559.1 hypothetical protein [Mycolicibacter acidiphilus]